MSAKAITRLAEAQPPASARFSPTLLTQDANAPGRLRQLALALAVRGVLVEQRASEGTAHELLAHLGRSGHGPDVASLGLDVRLPASWCWASFGEVATIESNLVDPKKHLDLPHVAPDNIEKRSGRLLEYRTIREDGVTSGKHRFFPGQILYSKIRPNLSKAVTVDFEGLCSADMYPLGVKIDRRYLHLFLLSDLFLRQVVRDDNRIAMPKVNQQQLSATVVAVPPLAEQKRIVAKVDQLMALCDELEAKQAKKRDVGDRLTTAALAAITSAKTQEDFEVAWRRVHRNFNSLFNSTAVIADLRQALLELSMKGLLVRQNLNAGTAEPLVQGLEQRRAALAKRLAVRTKEARVADVPEAEQPYPIPPSWRWVRLGALGCFVGGGTPSKANPEFWKGEIPWVSPKDMKRPFISDAKDHISRPALDSSAAKLIPSPSLLMVLRGMILVHSFPVAITEREVAVNQDMRALVLADPSMAPFLLRACQAARSRVLARVERSSHGTCRLDAEVAEELPIALPPAEEQDRIVSRLGQLLALCDELEDQLLARDKVAEHLAESISRSWVA